MSLRIARSFPLALAAVALSPAAAAQFGPEQVITLQADHAWSVYATDLDGDGDADVLSASRVDNKIAWYENLGGGSFGTQQLITPTPQAAVDQPWSVYATDLDGDNDADVLSASASDDTIAWYENLGAGSFGPLQVITTQAHFAAEVYATDLDGDGDADVLSASASDDKIAWYENLGGGSFGLQQPITTQAANAVGVYATDLDGDGDADVLSASWNDNKIAWYENLGGGSFGQQQIITTAANSARSVYATDLDGDNDADVLSASFGDDKIAWYENLGGGSFGTQRIITTLAYSALDVYATDLDGDGDADVLSASKDDDEIAWYENLGGGSFGPQQIITVQADGARAVYATDLDGDGDSDVLSASVFDNKIAWYENQPPIGTSYCSPAFPNSTGLPALIVATGSSAVVDNAVTLRAEHLPPGQFGYFLAGQTQGFFNPPSSQGILCLSGDIGRYQNVIIQGPTGHIRIDLTSIPVNPPVPVLPGDTWNFQCWFRDMNPASTSNFTDAVSVTFM